MTTERDDGARLDSPSFASTATPTTIGALYRSVGRHVRRNPALVVPFVVAGLLVALADRVRQWDPIPVATPRSFEQTLSVQYSVFPSGTARTGRELGALLDLHLSYFLGAVALELLVPLVIGVAGWVTIVRTVDADYRLDSLARYLGCFLAVALISLVVGSSNVGIDSAPVGILAIVVVSLLGVRLFLLPGFVARGARLTTAVTRSVRQSRGNGWLLFSLIVVFGLTSWGFAQISVVGGLLSTAIVAPIHAVSIATLLPREGRSPGETYGD